MNKIKEDSLNKVTGGSAISEAPITEMVSKLSRDDMIKAIHDVQRMGEPGQIKKDKTRENIEKMHKLERQIRG